MLSSLTGEKFNHRELFAVKNSSYIDKFWVGVSEQQVSNTRASASAPRPACSDPKDSYPLRPALFLIPYRREATSTLERLDIWCRDVEQFRSTT